VAAKIKSDSHLEIAHVLFIDVVGYSKLLVNEQRAVIEQLNQIVRKTPQVRKSDAAGKLIRLPAGDGMALVFFQTPEEPVQCAMEIARALKNRPRIEVRMGVHSGPVDQIKDVNDQRNVAGAGINIAQRVMSCGDARHILVSKRVADDLAHDSLWQPLLHDLGEIEVKHGAKLGIVNLYSSELGNSRPPEKFAQEAPPSNGSPERAVDDAKAPEKSIALLPFESLSADPNNTFFADAIQDEILTDLSKIADLRVISRTSVMQYKTRVKRNLRDIADELGVAHIVEGSVQQAGNRVRVRAQLIDIVTFNVRMPRPFCEGLIARARGDATAASVAFGAARTEIRNILRDQPEYAEGLCLLAMIDAALGRKQEAIEAGRRAAELLPVEKDAMTGQEILRNLAITYAWSGENDLAIKQLEELLPLYGPISYGQLRLHPWWDSLRDHPRFETIVEESKKPVALN
jgi:TolB-like protein